MADIPAWLVKGCKVGMPAKSLQGTVKYIGSTKFASGKWVGIALTTPDGKHNGTFRVITHLEHAPCAPNPRPNRPTRAFLLIALQNVRYFECPDNHGAFARVSQVVKIDAFE